ncbi:MAG: SusE domain-containing protein [Alistipes sp.]|nr:SusE domain-containing protein [Alistipes sp.]
MKFELKKLAVLAGAFGLLLGACDKNEPDDTRKEEGKELKASVLTIDPQNVVVDSSAAGAAAVAFSWSSAAEGADYALYVAAEGESIFDGVVLYEGKGLALTLSNGELNALALKEFGGVPGETVSLQAAVSASLGDESKTSSSVRFSVTLGAAEIIKPATLYMMGGALETGWDERVPLPSVSEGVYRVENIVMKFGLPEDNRGFKFYVSESDDVPVYGQSTESGAAFGDIVILYRGDSQFYPLHNGYESGVYTVEVNLNDLKLKLEKTSDVDEFVPSEYLYILGDNMEYGWDYEEGNALAPLSDNEYEGKGIVLSSSSSFKIYGYDWSPEYIRDASASDYYTMKESDGSDVRFVPGDNDPNFKYGYYTVNVNLNTMKLTLTLESEIEDVDPSTLFYIVGEYVCNEDNNWALAEGDLTNALIPVSDGVYEGKDIYLEPRSNFKFSFTGWSPQYVRDSSAGEYWTMKLSENGDDTRFNCEASDPSFEAGLYTVRMDTGTMKVTLTKQ